MAAIVALVGVLACPYACWGELPRGCAAPPESCERPCGESREAAEPRAPSPGHDDHGCQCLCRGAIVTHDEAACQDQLSAGGWLIAVYDGAAPRLAPPAVEALHAPACRLAGRSLRCALGSLLI